MVLEEVKNSNSQPYYYHPDQLGSIRAMTGSNGQVAKSYQYDAYGNVLKETGSSSIYNPFGYAGEYTDEESGLQYLRARYYDPSTQQFISRDPIEDITGQPYAYALGSPLNFTDPSGQFPIEVLCPECIIATTVGGGVVGFGAYALTHQNCFDWGEAAKWTAIGTLVGFTGGAYLSELILPLAGAHIAYILGGGAAATPVLGRLPDFENYALQSNETRLKVWDWAFSWQLNEIWIKLYLNADKVFKTISDPERDIFRKDGSLSFFGQELQLIEQHGGSYEYMPPVP